MNNFNYLINEKSPYLKQHSFNPIKWYPWGKEAFENAKANDKPIFLSIGYSTCHWCHVMEKESFVDDEVAKILNDEFVCIKVDREERPDIDAVYMEVCQRLTGSGGWPLTVFLTPMQKPFFAGTYFPKTTKYGRIGLIELATNVIELWKSNKEKLLEESEKITKHLTAEYKVKGKQPTQKTVDAAYSSFSHAFDNKNGGFGSAPKFPSPHNLLFLTKYSFMQKSEKAKHMVEKTLSSMLKGGLFDHIGGGFSRYSTDEYYLLPHFEKMLYDNALLLYAYSYYLQFEDANKEIYTRIIELTADYLMRELKDANGGLYCAQDADSEGMEGSFYLFSPKQIFDILKDRDAVNICEKFDINNRGHLEGLCVPNLLKTADSLNAIYSMDKVRNSLLEYRKRRPLLTDNKILTSWNALAIAGFARAYIVLEDKRYLEYAKSILNFVQSNLMDEKGDLFLRWCEGELKGEGQLDDYAFLAWAGIELYEATFDTKYLTLAKSLSGKMVELFDDEGEGLFMYSKTSEQLIKRPKEFYDGALPSGNSVAAYVFSKLERLTLDKRFAEKKEELLNIITELSEQSPTAYSFGLFAMCDALQPQIDLICVAPDSLIPNELKIIRRTHAIKNLSIILKTPSNKEELDMLAEHTANYKISDSVSYYICKDGTCSQPLKNTSEIIQDIKVLYN